MIVFLRLNLSVSCSILFSLLFIFKAYFEYLQLNNIWDLCSNETSFVCMSRSGKKFPPYSEDHLIFLFQRDLCFYFHHGHFSLTSLLVQIKKWKAIDQKQGTPNEDGISLLRFVLCQFHFDSEGTLQRTWVIKLSETIN